MINKDKYHNMTEKAWDKLYDRLDHDNLLIDNNRTTVRVVPYVWGSIAAAVAIILMIVLFRSTSSNTPSSQLLSKSSNSDQGTLVTTLEDQSTVFLADKSSLIYPSHFPMKERKIKLDGEALFDVTHHQNRPFIIETQRIIIKVLGTCFNVKSRKDGKFELGVFRGLVKVTDKRSGQAELVRAGEMIRLERSVLNRYKMPDNHDLQKYSHHIRFKDETLGNILKAVNTISGGKKIRTVASVRNRRLTVTFSDDSPQTIALLLSEALHLQYIEQENEIRIQ